MPSQSHLPIRRAVLLLSGGLDSTTLLALARRDGFAIHALTFRYGQRHASEVEAARRVAYDFGVAELRCSAATLAVRHHRALRSLRAAIAMESSDVA